MDRALRALALALAISQTTILAGVAAAHAQASQRPGLPPGVRVGINARTSINPTDFGLAPLFGDAIEIVVDVEFQRDP